MEDIETDGQADEGNWEVDDRGVDRLLERVLGVAGESVLVVYFGQCSHVGCNGYARGVCVGVHLGGSD